MKELKDMTVAKLKAYAAANNIPLDKLKLKPEILERIETTLKERAAAPPTAPTDAPDGPPEGTGEPAAPGVPSDIKSMKISRVLRVTKPLVKGDDVKAVQAALIALKFHCGVEGANGVYNASTAFAVRMFQAHNRLIVSGKVEKFTAQKLGAIWTEPPKA